MNLRFWENKKILPFRHKFDIPAIPANSSIDYDEENALRHYRKYTPFEFIFVRNLSATTVTVYLNYNENIGITAISMGEATSKAIPFSSFQIYNETAININNNEITVWVEKI